jgi:hypothetical protein
MKMTPAVLILLAACSSAPQAPPGGGAASRAAGEAAEAYAQGLRRGIVGGQRDRAVAALGAGRRALQQYAADQASYPEASSCAALAAALGGAVPAVPATDPWGNAYDCRSAAGGYRLLSAGEDGVRGTGDDLVVEGGSPPAP